MPKAKSKGEREPPHSVMISGARSKSPGDEAGGREAAPALPAEAAAAAAAAVAVAVAAVAMVAVVTAVAGVSVALAVAARQEAATAPLH